MHIKSTLLGAALALVSAVAANATTLTLTDPPGQSDIPYELVFQATGSASTLIVQGYQVPSFEFVTQSAVTDLTTGSSTNLLGQTWGFTPAAQGSLAFQQSDGSGVNALVFGAVTPPYLDTFRQTFATTSGDLYAYKFNFSNSSYATPSQLVVTTMAGVPETSTWVMMLAGFAGLGYVGYRRNRMAAVAA